MEPYLHFHNTLMPSINMKSQSVLRQVLSIFKATSPHSAIQCFLFQFTASSCLLKIIQQLRTSSPTSSRLLYSYLYFYSNSLFQKAVRTQEVTNPISHISFYFMQDVRLLLDSVSQFCISHTICTTYFPLSSPAPRFKIFQVYMIYFPQCPSFSTIQCYDPNVALHQFLS